MIKAFLKDSLLYTIASLFTRGIGFVLLPIYTRVISKEEYGLFDYITTIGLMVGVVVTLEITQAIYRFIPEYQNKPTKQIELASTGFWFSFNMYIVLCIFTFIFSEQLALIILDDIVYSNLIKITSILFLTNAILHNFMSLMRARLLTKQVVIVSIINALSVAVFSLSFVIYFDLGLVGLVVGQLLGVILAVLVAYKWTKKWIRLIFCFESFVEMLKFSAPLVFSSIGVVLAMFVDRIMLKEILGAEQLASYAVAIKIASIVSLLMVGFQSALTPLIYANYKNNETAEKIAKLFHFYLLASLIFLLVISLNSGWLVLLAAGAQYSEASNYVAPLVCSALISSMYLFFPGLSLAKKSYIIMSISLVVGLLNVFLNYIFIPRYGAIGAAFSTLFSMFISFLIGAFVAHPFYRVPVNKTLTFLVFSLIGVTLYGAN